MDAAETKAMIAWLREQGATQMRVGEVSVVFAVPSVRRLEITAAKSVDYERNPLGGDLGVEDALLLASV